MKKIARRGFLRVMGGAAVGGKKIAEEVAKQAGVSLGLGGGNEIGSGIAGPMPSAASSGVSLGKWLLKNALPDWKLKEIRENSKRVYHLDPDLAALRSFSMTTKIGIQQQRNFDRAVSGIAECSLMDDQRQAFNQKHGFWL